MLSILNYLDLIGFFFFVSFKLPYNLNDFLKLIIEVINQPLFLINFPKTADYDYLPTKLEEVQFTESVLANHYSDFFILAASLLIFISIILVFRCQVCPFKKVNRYIKKIYVVQRKDFWIVNLKGIYIPTVFTSICSLLYRPEPTAKCLLNTVCAIIILNISFVFIFWSSFYVGVNKWKSYPETLAEVRHQVQYSHLWIALNDLRNVFVAVGILLLPSTLLLFLVLTL